MNEENAFTWRVGTAPINVKTDLLDRFTDRARKVVELSLREALQLGHNYIGTEHILLALIREGEGAAAIILAAKFPGGLQGARQAVIQQLSGYDLGAAEAAKRRGEAEKKAAEAVAKDEAMRKAGPFTGDVERAREVALKYAIDYGDVPNEGLLETAQSFYEFLTGAS